MTPTTLIQISILLIGFLQVKPSPQPDTELTADDDSEVGAHETVGLPRMGYIDYNLKSCHQQDYSVPWDEALARTAGQYVGKNGLQSGTTLLMRKRIRRYVARLAAHQYCNSKWRFFSNNSPLSVGCASKTYNSNTDLEIVCLYSLAGTF